MGAALDDRFGACRRRLYAYPSRAIVVQLSLAHDQIQDWLGRPVSISACFARNCRIRASLRALSSKTIIGLGLGADLDGLAAASSSAIRLTPADRTIRKRKATVALCSSREH